MNFTTFALGVLIFGIVNLAIASPGRSRPRFRVLVVASVAKDHQRMIAAAKPFFGKLGLENNLEIDFTDDATTINDVNLKHYKVFVMLQLAPFDMTYEQQGAMERFVENGNGWVGIHAAGLPGRQFLGPDTKYWDWYELFLGGVIYSPHPAYQRGTVIFEDRKHPATKNMPERLEVSDEWYEFNESPRKNVHVLAVADESTYKQNKPMGDHPIIWTNSKFRRMIYISIGHDPTILDNPVYDILLRDSILWAWSKGK